MKYLCILVVCVSVLNAWSKENCVVAIPDDCPEGKVCAKYNSSGGTKCISIPDTAPLVFDLPVSSLDKVICSQSGRFSTATHSYINMLYAIDLATPYDKPASKIYAAADGVAYIHDGCKVMKGTNEQSETDNCGGGYGNQVKILHKGGYVSIYAHLEKVFVKNKQKVKKNTSIGIEGNTGSAAYRHLHWDIHKLYGKESDWVKVLETPGWGGASVPAKIRIRINGTEKIIDSSKIACRWLDMTQPSWSGSYKGQ